MKLFLLSIGERTMKGLASWIFMTFAWALILFAAPYFLALACFVEWLDFLNPSMHLNACEGMKATWLLCFGISFAAFLISFFEEL